METSRPKQETWNQPVQILNHNIHKTTNVF